MVRKTNKKRWLSKLQKLKDATIEIAKEIHGQNWWMEDTPITNMGCFFDEAIAEVRVLEET